MSPTVTSIYSVTSTYTTGCTETRTFAVNVNPLPTLSISGANTLCIGQSINLTANGANTYTWSNNSNNSSITISPTISSSYSVNGTSTAGCISASAAISNVTVYANPVLSISGNTVLCTGETGTLIASGANSYAWSTGAASSSITVNNTPNTYNYTVTGSSVNNCSNSTTVQVIINPCTGINENQQNLSLFPNPAKTQITLSAEMALGKTLSVWDALGKLVYETKINQNRQSINIGEWPKGMYTLKIEGNKTIHRFIKE